jgi:hypothetical protein
MTRLVFPFPDLLSTCRIELMMCSSPGYQVYSQAREQGTYGSRISLNIQRIMESWTH